jgi:porphobilinogen synthase
MNHLTRRPRRNRKNEVIRNLVEENSLSLNDFIYPVFVLEGENKAVEIASMPGIYRLSIDRMLDEIAACVDLGIKAFAPFPVIDEAKKDRFAQESYNPDNVFL